MSGPSLTAAGLSGKNTLIKIKTLAELSFLILSVPFKIMSFEFLLSTLFILIPETYKLVHSTFDSVDVHTLVHRHGTSFFFAKREGATVEKIDFIVV